jgi:fumarate hydratase subunit alpha
MPTKISALVKNAVIQASTTFREDQIAAYKDAISKEESDNSRWVMELLLENAQIAKKNKVPLCDDTGIPHILVELGHNTYLPRDLFNNIEIGVVEGLRKLPGRPMAVLGDDIKGLNKKKVCPKILGK